MNRGRFSGALAFMFLFAALAWSQDASAPESPKVFREARKSSEDFFPSSFEFELGGFTYKISGNGAGRRIKGDSTRLFNLRLAGGDRLASVYYATHRENVLLICEVNDGVDVSDGFIARLEQPSMRARWKTRIPAFNVGPALIEEEHVYLTGFNFVARLDLRKGEYVWRHDEALRNHGRGFDAFETPRVEGDAVVFKERPQSEAGAKTLRVLGLTGKILGGIE